MKAPRATKVPLQSSSNFNVHAYDVDEKKFKLSKREPEGDKSIEETYQKKTQLEHILLRPDTNVGSIEKHTQKLWVYEDGKMVNRSVIFVPGLYKIFDEILVNAADNKQRDPSMDTVKVSPTHLIFDAILSTQGSSLLLTELLPVDHWECERGTALSWKNWTADS